MLLSLGPLADDDVSALAASWLGAVPGPRLTRQLGLAAGNPLYVRELLDALSRWGHLRTSDGVVEVAGSGTADYPAVSLAEVIADRLDFLSADARDVLRTASLLGADFSAADLAAIAEHSPTRLARVVEEALAAGVLECAGTSLRFRHGLLKESLYETMPRALRAILHRHAAEVLIASGAPAERIADLVLPVLAETDGWEVEAEQHVARETLGLLVPRRTTGARGERVEARGLLHIRVTAVRGRRGHVPDRVGSCRRWRCRRCRRPGPRSGCRVSWWRAGGLVGGCSSLSSRVSRTEGRLIHGRTRGLQLEEAGNAPRCLHRVIRTHPGLGQGVLRMKARTQLPTHPECLDQLRHRQADGRLPVADPQTLPALGSKVRHESLYPLLRHRAPSKLWTRTVDHHRHRPPRRGPACPADCPESAPLGRHDHCSPRLGRGVGRRPRDPSPRRGR